MTELENMIPWERDIYISLLQDYIESENLKKQQKEGVENTDMDEESEQRRILPSNFF